MLADTVILVKSLGIVLYSFSVTKVSRDGEEATMVALSDTIIVISTELSSYFTRLLALPISNKALEMFATTRKVQGLR